MDVMMVTRGSVRVDNPASGTVTTTRDPGTPDPSTYTPTAGDLAGDREPVLPGLTGTRAPAPGIG